MRKLLITAVILSLSLFTFNALFAGEASITGMVHYAGDKTGPVIVAAVNLPIDMEEFNIEAIESLIANFEDGILLDTLIYGPGEYSFTNLEDGMYVVAAFMDHQSSAANVGELQSWCHHGLLDLVVVGLDQRQVALMALAVRT